MIVQNLYDSTLIQPNISGNANILYAVSGYASATFARRHIVELLQTNENFEINLIIGMPKAKSDHLAFLSLHSEFRGKFKGYYLQNKPPVHCKIYSWFNNNNAFIGFAGSANYSQYGFFSEQQLNQLSEENPVAIKNLYDELLVRSIFIPEHEIVLPEGHKNISIEGSVSAGQIKWEIPNKRVTISFLDKKGVLPTTSGLNWGQRKGREPNQAYLSLKSDSRKEGFLPERAFNFSLITDDGETFDCAVAQDGNKAIHSTNSNSIIGKYFRTRIGVPLGSPITIEDLEHYGRTDYTIEKINNETFLLDFSNN